MAVTVPSSAEIVVIGGGMGGLTAAALLAKAGREVVVVEPERRPGGYLAGFQRRQFVFDSAIHWLNQCGPGGFLYKILSWLGDDFPRCVPLEKIRRYRGDSYDYMLTAQPDELKRQLMADLPGNQRGLTRLFDDARVIGDTMARFNRLMRSTVTMSPLEHLVLGLKMMVWGRPFARHYKKHAVDGLARYVPSGRLSEIFASEETLLSVLVPLGWAYTGDFQAPPVGGSQAFPQWLVGRIEASGSQVCFGKRVSQVLLDGQRAVGVRLATGETIRARWVLAACDVETVYRHMLPEGVIPDKLMAKVSDAELYDSSVTLSLGLDCPSEALGFGEEMVYLSQDGVSRADLNGGDPARSGLAILAPSSRDPTMAPAGKGTLTIYCPARLDYADHWRTEAGLKRGPAYKAFKRDYARTLLDRVEASIAPGLQDHIEVLDIATPVTHWRYTGNKGGSIMGARPNRANIRSRVAHYRTPVKHLVLAGHWAELGGGVPVAAKAGSNASLLVLRKEDPKAFRTLVSVMDRA